MKKYRATCNGREVFIWAYTAYAARHTAAEILKIPDADTYTIHVTEVVETGSL